MNREVHYNKKRHNSQKRYYGHGKKSGNPYGEQRGSRRKKHDGVKKQTQAQIRLQQAEEYLTEEYSIEKYRLIAESMNRKFFLHVGPTNSGKTYTAIQALKNADSGTYLGPLRLLALEMYDKLNQDGYYCDLLTGEEHIAIPESTFVASTIELCDYGRHYDVAIIDEGQMICDRHRGDKWLKAVYMVDAAEVHVCVAPEAEPLYIKMIEGFNATYEIIHHERLAPLKYHGSIERLQDVKKGDALIVFSRKSVLAVAAELEKRNIKASTIYGALPPVSRREEVRRFVSGETQVVVATDAIGMGVSLPIHRIIFCETTKYDGIDMRPLKNEEVKQIAGRAGRFGIYDVGYVLAIENYRLVKAALDSPPEILEKLTLPFPKEALASDYTIGELLKAWTKVKCISGFDKADMKDSLTLYSYISEYETADKELVFSLITCPVDIKNKAVVEYWALCSKAILNNTELPEPEGNEETLEECETKYKQFDVRHQLLRINGIEENRMSEKYALCEKINGFLKDDKVRYLNKCTVCGRRLPPLYRFGICERCFRKRRYGK